MKSDVLDELGATCHKDEHLRPCTPPCEMYQGIEGYQNKISQQEEELVCMQGAAYYYFQEVVRLREATNVAISLIEGHEATEASRVIDDALRA